MQSSTRATFAGHRWAVVLAAGDGRRLRRLTTDRQGVVVPKQFCSIRGRRSLLLDAIERAERVVSAQHTIVVVAERHRRWWERDLAGHPNHNVIVQPDNRGTANGILLAVFSIVERDPEARLVFFPSDHFFRDETILANSVREALVELDDDTLVLLGISPEHAETQYGWIVPLADACDRVAAFVEKPGRVEAIACLAKGAVWNSFLFAAKSAAILALYETRLPRLIADFRMAFASPQPRFQALADLYSSLESVDFSRAVLERSAEFLRLRVVPPCGWTDLGTPERVATCVSSLRLEDLATTRIAGQSGRLDLSSAIRGLQKRDDRTRAVVSGLGGEGTIRPVGGAKVQKS